MNEVSQEECCGLSVVSSISVSYLPALSITRLYEPGTFEIGPQMTLQHFTELILTLLIMNHNINFLIRM